MIEVSIKTVGHEVKVTVNDGGGATTITLPKEQAAAFGDMLKAAARANQFSFSVTIG